MPRPLTLKRATLLVAALCAGALALALGATVAVERAHPGITRAPSELFAPLPIPRVDAHQALAPATRTYAVAVARASGLAMFVNLSGGAAGGALEARLGPGTPHDRREVVLTSLDPRGCCDAGWLAREAGRLERARELGASGLAVLGEPDGARLTALPGSSPLWDACARLGLPVVLGEVGTLADRATLAERYPAVRFVLTTAWRDAGDGAAVRRLMDRLPNLWVDTSDLLAGPGPIPGVREAILAHPDRVLFGSGVQYVASGDVQGIVLREGAPILLDAELLGGKDRQVFFLSLYRYLETRDRVAGEPDGEPAFTGIGLSRDVLQQLYHRNAERLFRVRVPEDAE